MTLSVFSHSIFERFSVDEENAANTVVWTGSVFGENLSSRKRIYMDGALIGFNFRGVLLVGCHSDRFWSRQ